MLSFAILLLLFTANGAPIIARNWLGSRYDWPVDGGMVCAGAGHFKGFILATHTRHPY